MCKDALLKAGLFNIVDGNKKQLCFERKTMLTILRANGIVLKDSRNDPPRITITKEKNEDTLQFMSDIASECEFDWSPECSMNREYVMFFNNNDSKDLHCEVSSNVRSCGFIISQIDQKLKELGDVPAPKASPGKKQAASPAKRPLHPREANSTQDSAAVSAVGRADSR